MCVRSRLALSAIFLGSGGIWRGEVLEELGGWQERPFTAEDIDMSYRARLRGWFVAYEDQPLLETELPATYIAYKRQQRRWARSCFRVLIDHFSAAIGQGSSGWLEATMLFRLIGVQTLIPLTVLVSTYVALALPRSPIWLASQLGFTALLVFSPTLAQLLLSQKLCHRAWLKRARRLLGSLPLGVALSVSVLSGFWDTLRNPAREWDKTLRTGEQGIMGGSARRWLWSELPVLFCEIVLGTIALTGCVFAIRNGYWESCLPLTASAGAYLSSAGATLADIAGAR